MQDVRSLVKRLLKGENQEKKLQNSHKKSYMINYLSKRVKQEI